MATYRKRNGTWRAEIVRHGVRESCSFRTKGEATEWATRREAEILHSKGRGKAIAYTFADALKRYKQEVTPQKRGKRWEEIRINKFLREIDFVGENIARITPETIGKWRDKRTKEVKEASVRRELELISAVFEAARREWRWINENPMRDVRRPKASPPRDRLISDAEREKILSGLGYCHGKPPETKMQVVAYAFLFALETAMRAGEICNLKWSNVNLEKRFVRLEITKNGDYRHVALSSKAVELLKNIGENAGMCFGVSSAVLSTLFRRAVAAAKIKNLTFHDTRHHAITQLAQKIEVLDLARMIGHRDLKSLMTYYNPTASEIAERLG